MDVGLSLSLVQIWSNQDRWADKPAKNIVADATYSEC